MDLSTSKEILNTLIQYASLYGLKLISAIAIFYIGKWAVGIGVNLIGKVMEKAKIDLTLVSFFKNLFKALGVTFVIIAALSQLGIETTSLAAIIAAAGLAIGLSLQGSLSNLAAGIMLIIFRPFKVKDYIHVAGAEGHVNDINIFTTTLTSTDNKKIIIPNAKITDDNIINFSTKPTRRIDMVFGIGYDDDLLKAKKVLAKILKDDKRILETPAPTIAVCELADSSVNFAVRPWVKSGDYFDVMFDLTEKVKLTFDKEGISIPYPQQDTHLKLDNAPDIKAILTPKKKKVTKKKSA